MVHPAFITRGRQRRGLKSVATKESQVTKPAQVKAVAYCSSANLGAGFDVFGLALDIYWDTVTASWGNSRGVRIKVEGKREGLPESPSKNSAGPPAVELLRRAGG